MVAADRSAERSDFSPEEVSHRRDQSVSLGFLQMQDTPEMVLCMRHRGSRKNNPQPQDIADFFVDNTLALAMHVRLQVIDRQQFEVVVHAKMGARPFAKERIPPYR